jgi:hypothetical protein
LLCCFPPTKVDIKADKKKDVTVENGKCQKSEDQVTTKATSIQKMKYFFRQGIFALHILKGVLELKALTI